MDSLDGSGYGSGDGYGYDYGSGDGYGYGYGSGDGSGYGSGYGYGDGSGSGYWSTILRDVARRANIAVNNEVVLAFWKSDKHGQPSNGGHGQPVSVGTIQKVDGPLAICSNRALHGTMEPHRWTGQRLWLVALYHPVIFESDKVGSLKRKILLEVTPDLIQ